MVAADEKGEVGGVAAAGVVFVEVADGAVFRGNGHCGEVVGVADGLGKGVSKVSIG